MAATSDFRRSGRNQAKKNQWFGPDVADLVLFPARNENGVPRTDSNPCSGSENLALACMEKDLVLPDVNMTRRMTVWRQIETTHAKIDRSISRANDDPACHALGHLIVDMHGAGRFRMHNFHRHLLKIQ
jgi:hypothetical protein